MTLALDGLRSRQSTAGGWLSATLAAVGVAVLLPLATFLTAAWLLGWQLQSVQSGSMEPTLPVGSLLVVGQVDPATVEPGQMVVFRSPIDPDRLVTHRVVSAAPGGAPGWITKGDANNVQDPFPVTPELIRGRPLWSVTHLGTVMDWLQWPRSLVLVIVPGALLVLAALRDRRAPGHSI